VITLPQVLQAWATPDFSRVFAEAVQQLDVAELPLQQALAHSSHVSDSPRRVIVLQTTATASLLQIKAGIFYAGVIAGSCCADDPTPLCEQTEYCEVEVRINRLTGMTRISLLPDSSM